MCEPATIIAGTALVASAAGTYMSYKAQKENQEAQNKAAEYNAQIQERQAVNYEEQARDVEANVNKEESNLRSDVRRIRGAQKAAYAGSGVLVEGGSASDVAQSTETSADFDALTLKSNAAKEARALRTQNRDALDQAQLSRMSKNTSNMGANATLLSGASNLGLSYYSAFGKKTK